MASGLNSWMYPAGRYSSGGTPRTTNRAGFASHGS
jgi:hypothetical protein